MMNEILNLLNLYVSNNQRINQQIKQVEAATDDQQLKTIIADMQPKELQVIGLFEINTEVSLKELPQLLAVSQASTSRITANLEKLQLITRHKTELNNKEWLLDLTETGQKILAIKKSTDEKRQAKLNDLAKDYSQTDLQQITDFLRKVVKVDQS
ncbi:MarR family winged helix-turn-helix transcriptional regulator [Companilactobacillus furfuricola]|uniref:MarR family winged helix-turn-helix transcriptional regulator n=1 Tax=Companilactobacillus furfuricola TaxID=1462575 RepID=UPI000F7B6C2C|nr:hypothetical protein [Companilactobacillus furfuricola]